MVGNVRKITRWGESRQVTRSKEDRNICNAGAEFIWEILVAQSIAPPPDERNGDDDPLLFCRRQHNFIV